MRWRNDLASRCIGLPDRARRNGGSLQLRDVTIAFPTRGDVRYAARRVSLTVDPGEIVGIVGESGAGKSVTCRAAAGLIPSPGEVVEGQLRLGVLDLTSLTKRQWRTIRGREIGIVFQDPSSALDPVQRVGTQLAEVAEVVGGLRRGQARARAIELLRRVEIAQPERRYYSYPHELSGGMRQRIAIALALAAEPRFLLADEPTASLDVTVQATILALLRSLQEETGMGMVLVSHDFGVIAQCAQTVVVMYGGYVVERGPVDRVFARPLHPYTQGLLDSLIPLGASGDEIKPIAGAATSANDVPDGCPFQPRCRHRRTECADVTMDLLGEPDGQETACPFVTAFAAATSSPAA
jgi:peptide/nickel transport system ATP-binding protein